MSTPLLAAIDIGSYASSSRGLSPKQLSYVHHVFARIAPGAVEDALHYLRQTTGLYSSYFDVTALSDVNDVVTLLDSGVKKAFVTREQLAQLKDVGHLHADRIVLSVAGDQKEEIGNASGDQNIGIYAHGVKDNKFVHDFLQGYGASRPDVFIALQTASENDVVDAVKLGATVVVPASQLTVDPTNTPGLIDVAKVLMANAKTDRQDGLFTTLVTDERGIALGLVYSSEKSVSESLRTGTGVYQSRKRGLWYKGESSGDVQELVRVGLDCDSDCLQVVVRQKGRGFCHLATATCFGHYSGLSRLQQTLESRKASAPEGSYTARLFNDPKLLQAKIMEEASELCEATTKEDIAFEAADLLYFALTKCVAAGVSLSDVEQSLDAKSVKVKRRKGDAKGPWAAAVGVSNGASASTAPETEKSAKNNVTEAAPTPKVSDDPANAVEARIQMQRYDTATASPQAIQEALQRPSQRSTDKIMNIVNPIIKDVRENGDKALLSYTHKFERATSLTSPVLKAPFPESLMQLPPETIEAIDVSFENIRKFHAAQKESKPLQVETMPGVVCSRFMRPIERVGLYVPGGTAVLPSTALMLGVPAMVAGCKKIVIASPPRADGSLTPEIVYVAHKVGAESIVLAGGAQAVAAMAYGTESVSKVDKILGPGNQFVTAAKMVVSNDTSAGVSIDMPAGPSEVLVIADETANPAFVASDLLSQAEHGVDSQVVCIAVDLSEQQLAAIEDELHRQAQALPRVDIVKGAIEHSVTLKVRDINEAMALSNLYAPEHLILQVKDAEKVVDLVQNAGSVFIGPWTPESVGDYSAGVNHSLPTYGYAKQYSGVNLGSYVKHITSSNLTAEGLKNVGRAVMQLAKVEELEAHRRAVAIRLEHMAASS
ncbi:histidinol dehydrogenase [Verruconis gallopava]|uniref:Histidine biosynthesis trifunctional protein n=1 Tax=Verruconis gallopava TaxID=253628 RepID=A0A0D2BBR3_9PEZI|nr:histidinol dehydrogenase [Verruconis gallopava]KIW08819.1 histidinol dehydrogenase [Verruconis gallopava]